VAKKRKRTSKAQKAALAKKDQFSNSFMERHAEDIKGISAKHMLFLYYFFGEAGANKAKAARMAGFSRATAGQIGHNITREPKIMAFIEKFKAELGFSSQEVLIRLKQITDTNYAKVIEQYSTGEKTLEQLEEDGFDMSLITSVDMKERVLKLMDKNKALEMLGKALGAFVEPNRIHLENLHMGDRTINIISQVPTVEMRRALPKSESDIIDVEVVERGDEPEPSEQEIKEAEECLRG